jgi:hypothetical protein
MADRDGRLRQLSATLAELGAEEDEIVDQLTRLGYAPTIRQVTVTNG